MAAFVYKEADHPYIELEARVGEEIPTEMAQAWATLRMAWAIEYVGDRLSDLEDAVAAIGRR